MTAVRAADAFATGQAEGLVATGIRQDRALPAPELVQPSQLFHQFLARPHHQVKRIGQNHFRAQFLQVFDRKGAHGAIGTDRHEGWRVHRSPRERETTAPRASAGSVDREFHAELPDRSSSMASP